MTNSSYTISTQFSIQKLPISTQLSILTINVFGLTAKEMLTTLSSDQKLQQQPLNRRKKKVLSEEETSSDVTLKISAWLT